VEQVEQVRPGTKVLLERLAQRVSRVLMVRKERLEQQVLPEQLE